MDTLNAILEFLKNFVKTLYDNTVGPLITLSGHVIENRMDKEDMDALKRVVSWMLLLAVLAFAPEWLFVKSLLGSYAVYDVVTMIARTFFDLADLYKQPETQEAV